MAKKDDVRFGNEIDRQKGMGQSHIDNLRNDTLIPQSQMAQNNFTNASERQFEDYGRMMGDYQNWAKDGGFSAGDIGNIRARSVAPIRSIYAGANREVDRIKSLQGGYSPGYGTLKARMAREMSSGLSDASTNAEGMIAQLRNQGRQFGMAGQSSLYGASPGLTSTYGNLQNATTQNRLTGENLQANMFNNINQGYTGKRGQGFDYSWVSPAIGAAGSSMASDRELKENIVRVKEEDILKKLGQLEISEWNYIGDSEKHIGPMAQDFQQVFGKGDGNTISIIDAIGILMASNKALLKKVEELSHASV